jgi:hypothetical protein
MIPRRIAGLADGLRIAVLGSVSALVLLGALLVRVGGSAAGEIPLLYKAVSLVEPRPVIALSGPSSGGMDTISNSFRKCLALPTFVCWEQSFVAATGSVPKWFEVFKRAFDGSMREIGKCQEVARSISDFFKRIGGKPEFVAFKAKNWDYLTLDLPDGSNVAVTQNGYHVVVRLGARIYDAFTGPAGMEAQVYMSRLRAPFGYATEVVTQP